MNLSPVSIAKVIDHSLLNPAYTDLELKQGCELAAKYKVASVCIKPYAVRMAAHLLKGTNVAVGTVIGFPHGNSAVDIKVKEAEKACGDGAIELDAVVNIGKVLSRDWDYVRDEVARLVQTAHRCNALLKLIFENDFLPKDEFKLKLCEICNQTGVDFAKTSTGYGFVKGADGKYDYQGATDHDLRLMRAACGPQVQVKAAGGVRTLDDVLRVLALGVTRVGASNTEAILQEAAKRSL